MINYAVAFGAGFLTSLSPCVYPMLPLTLGFLSRQGVRQDHPLLHKNLSVLSFFVGQTLVFTFLGVAAVEIGEIFGFSSQSWWVHALIGLLLLVFAVISWFDLASSLFAKMNTLLPTNTTNSKAPSLLTGFIFGGSSALVASPCTSPVLGGVLSQIASDGSFWSGILEMLFFAFGMGFIFLVVGFGFIHLKKLPKSGHWMSTVHHLTSVFLFIGACYYFYQAWQA